MSRRGTNRLDSATDTPQYATITSIPPRTIFNLASAGAEKGTWGGSNGVGAHVPFDQSELRNVKHWGARGDGLTNDRSAIQTCINVGPGVVFFPPGIYIIDNGLSLVSDVLLRGAGMHATTIYAQSGSASSYTMFANTGLGTWLTSTTLQRSGITDMTIDGNAANRTGTPGGHNIWVRGPNSNPCGYLRFHRLRIVNAPVMAMPVQNVGHSQITDNVIENTGRDGISFWGNSRHNVVSGNQVENVGDDAIAFNARLGLDAGDTQSGWADMRDNVVADNALRGGDPPTAWNAGGNGGAGVSLAGCYRTTVTGNTILDVTAGGVRCLGWRTQDRVTDIQDNVIVGNTIMYSDRLGHGGTSASFNGCAIFLSTGDYVGFGGAGSRPNIRRITIANNNIWNPRGEGIWVVSSANGGTVEDILIEGNAVDGALGVGQDTNSAGINVGGASGDGQNRNQHFATPGGSINDVTIRNNAVRGFAYYGVRCTGVFRPTVDTNRVLDNGQKANCPGISLSGCTDGNVRFNRVRNTGFGATQTYGLEIASPGGTTVSTGNVLAGNATGPYTGAVPVVGGSYYSYDNICPAGGLTTRVYPGGG